MFDFRKEFVEYCESDVQLLAEGCLRFRAASMQTTKLNAQDSGVDPFKVSLTIASYCNYIFRRNYMRPESVGLIPENGYNPQQRTSNKCMSWLAYIAETEGIHIQHARNGGEVRCGKYLVDGICHKNKTIYEFNGCLWHGCLLCFTANTLNPYKQMYQSSVYYMHMDRIKYIKISMPGYRLCQIWEHEFDELCRTDERVKAFVERNRQNESINLRDALYGGRTNALKLYHKCKFGERIDYYDYTSLYPFVQAFILSGILKS